jgi:hypothetical protein
MRVPQHCQRAVAETGADLADLLAVAFDQRAGRRQRAVEPHREQPLLHQPAVLGAGRELLAHVAALLPVDAVQLVEAALEQQGLLHRKIAAAVGHAERQAQRVVVGRCRGRKAVRAQDRGSLAHGRQHAHAERRQTWVDVGHALLDAERLVGLRAEHDGGFHRRRAILDLHLGAQGVHRELLGQCRGPLAFGFDQQGLGPAVGHEHVVQEPPLRRQQCRPDRMTGRHLGRVVGDQPLQELDPIRAGEGDDAAVGEQGEGGEHAGDLGGDGRLGKQSLKAF